MDQGVRLAIIGAGNMGGAVLRGAVQSGVLRPEEVVVVDADTARRAEVAALGVRTSERAIDAAAAEQIMLAVKPQVFPAVSADLSPLPTGQIVISIMAGLSSGLLRRSLGDSIHVVRVMPNTPCQVGLGMTAIALGEGATPNDAALSHELFAAIGEVVDVEESQLHAVTAVSGSGPAYVFLLAEAMQQAAEQMGLPHRTARTLVTQTIRGAGALLNSPDRTATQLREAVTSPGGTTAAALEVMFETDLPENVVEALRAARDRGIDLDQ